MKNKLLLISLAFLFSLTFVMSASYSPCGDGYCDTAYEEDNPLSEYYCPLDCGERVNETWCDETYPRECNCGTCDTSRISDTNLNNWCTSHGYTKGEVITVCPFPFVEKFAFFKITGNKCKDGLIIIGMIIFILSFTLGALLFHRRKKKRR